MIQKNLVREIQLEVKSTITYITTILIHIRIFTIITSPKSTLTFSVTLMKKTKNNSQTNR